MDSDLFASSGASSSSSVASFVSKHLDDKAVVPLLCGYIILEKFEQFNDLMSKVDLSSEHIAVESSGGLVYRLLCWRLHPHWDALKPIWLMRLINLGAKLEELKEEQLRTLQSYIQYTCKMNIEAGDEDVLSAINRIGTAIETITGSACGFGDAPAVI